MTFYVHLTGLLWQHTVCMGICKIKCFAVHIIHLAIAKIMSLLTTVILQFPQRNSTALSPKTESDDVVITSVIDTHYEKPTIF